MTLPEMLRILPIALCILCAFVAAALAFVKFFGDYLLRSRGRISRTNGDETNMGWARGGGDDADDYDHDPEFDGDDAIADEVQGSLW